jgi:hypothetical protein
MKKAIAVIPFVAKRRRRSQAERGAKLGGPALLVAAGAVVAVVVRRRKRSEAGHDASQSELSDKQSTATTASRDDTPEGATSTSGQDDDPARGEGRPSTLDGDPAETVPLAGVEGVGQDAAIPDTATDDPIVREQEQAAAAEAGSIGGNVPPTPPTNEPDFATDPATRPVEEGSGSAYESFSEREG